MTVAVTALAKSKTGRKVLKMAIVLTAGFAVSFLIFIIVITSAVTGWLFGMGGPSLWDLLMSHPPAPVSTAGSVTVTFSRIEPAESRFARTVIPSAQTSPSVVTFPILYAAATQNGSCVMPWPILAGVTNEESSFGKSQLPGVSSGSNGAGAQGPFQFEPATFSAYANPAPQFPGAANPPVAYDAVDAAFAAARKLCENGILTNPQYALWTYNAGLNGVTFQLINGQYTPVYNDSIFQGSSDNPARYVADVLASAALYGSGTVSGTENLSVTGLAPGSGDAEMMGEQSAMWMYLFGHGSSCEKYLKTPCWDAMPTLLANFDGIALPTAPSAMRLDLGAISVPHAGDVVLFGGYVTTTDPKTHVQTTTLQINNNTYGVVIDSSSKSSEIALVGSNAIHIVQLPGPLTEGMQIDGMTAQVVGSPF